MKRTLKLVLVTLLVSTMLSGCTIISGLLGGDGLDPELIVLEELNSSYLNQHSQNYMDSFIEPMTEEELEEFYMSNVESEAAWLASYFGVDYTYLDEDTASRLIAATEALYQKIKFEVISSEKTGDDYIVTVAVEPIDIITKTFTEEMFNEYAAAALNDAEMLAMDDTAFSSRVVNDMLDVLDAAMPELGYVEAIEVEIGIDVSDEGYEVSFDDIEDGFHQYIIEYNFDI